MPMPTLFPLDEPLAADPDRPDPELWIERLVILSARDPTAVIREVTFRRGLNIIQTADAILGDDRVTGHSVGKTLLVRLIRYTLGEHHFGSDDTELRVRRRFPEAHVVAVWHVGGKPWTVVRPLGSSSPGDSRAAEGLDWIDAFESKEAAYRRFLETVEAQTLGNLPALMLGRDRSPKWPDLIGWLARDYQCGYRRANEWRHPDANSGVVLDRDDNALLMQWVTGLLSGDENRLRESHQQLLRDRAESKRKADDELRRVQMLAPTLRDKLGLGSNADPTEGELPIDRALSRAAAGKIESLKRLRQERRSASSYDSLRLERQQAEEALIDSKADVKSKETAIAALEARLLQLDDAAAPRPYAARPSFENCEAEPCWMKQRAAMVSGEDPAKEHYRQTLQEELEEQKRMVAAARNREAEAKRLNGRASAQLTAERDRLATELQGIDREIGRWEGYAEDAESYERSVRAAAAYEDRTVGLNNKVNESLKQQDALRQSKQQVLRAISGVYRQVLQIVFGDAAEGQILIDGNGLRPKPSDRLAPEGAAISVMTEVLAFDLAVVAASVCGLGAHPRFLIHDSPREADMEAGLFAKLFTILEHLEALFPGSVPSFQYLVTTTTAPPPRFASPAAPYVRLTLDALSDESRLLGAAF